MNGTMYDIDNHSLVRLNSLICKFLIEILKTGHGSSEEWHHQDF